MGVCFSKSATEEEVVVPRSFTYKIREADTENSNNIELASDENSNAGAYWIEGEELSKLERYDEALVMYNKAIEILPHYWYYLERGKIHLILGDSPSALEDFTKALEKLEISSKKTYDAAVKEGWDALSKREVQVGIKFKLWFESLIKLCEAPLEAIGGAEEELELATKLQEDRKNLIKRKIDEAFDESDIKMREQAQSFSADELFKRAWGKTTEEQEAATSHSDIVATSKVDTKAEATAHTTAPFLDQEIEAKTLEIYHVQTRINTIRKAKIDKLKGSINDIEGNEALYRFYQGFVEPWTTTYTVSHVIKSGLLVLNTSNIAVDVVVNLATLLPFGAGIIGQAVQVGWDAHKGKQLEVKAKTFVKISPNHKGVENLVEYLALRITLHYQDEILSPQLEQKTTGWFAKFIDKAKKLHEGITESLYGEKFPSAEEKLGYKYANELISKVAAGEFELMAGRSTLVDRLEAALIGQDPDFNEVNFGFE